MTAEQVAALEAVVARNPDDLDATRKLLAFYRERGQKVLGWNQMVAGRRPHLLRLIERHPESDLTWWPMKRSLDPVGYDQARALWLAHVEKPGSRRDAVARTRLLRISRSRWQSSCNSAQTMDPDGPAAARRRKHYYAGVQARKALRPASSLRHETIFHVVNPQLEERRTVASEVPTVETDRPAPADGRGRIPDPKRSVGHRQGRLRPHGSGAVVSRAGAPVGSGLR